MNRVNQTCSYCGHPLAEPDRQNLGCDDFKGARKRLEADLGRFMLVADGENGFLLLALKRSEFKAITE